MKLYEPSPEDEIVKQDEREEVYGLITQRIFGDKLLLDLWIARNVYNAPIRKLAILHHMSRYNVRRNLKLAEQAISEIKARLYLKFK